MANTARGRRQTRFPSEHHAPENNYINNTRHRKKHQKEPMLVHPESSSSVIMITSAENTPVTMQGTCLLDDQSSVRISSMQEGRATRLTNIDMVLEDTEMPSQRLRTQLFSLNETNTSLVNLDETEMILRDRPKSSVAQRWTRSGSIIPADVVEARRSSIYSMVTKRNQRRAQSVAQNSSITVENVVGNKQSARRETNGESTKNLSQISEEQLDSVNSSSSESTPNPLVKDLVFQTRTMRKHGEKLPLEQGTESTSPIIENHEIVSKKKQENRKKRKKRSDSPVSTSLHKKRKKNDSPTISEEVSEIAAKSLVADSNQNISSTCNPPEPTQSSMMNNDNMNISTTVSNRKHSSRKPKAGSSMRSSGYNQSTSNVSKSEPSEIVSCRKKESSRESSNSEHALENLQNQSNVQAKPENKTRREIKPKKGVMKKAPGISDSNSNVSVPVPRKRGRPRTRNIPVVISNNTEATVQSSSPKKLDSNPQKNSYKTRSASRTRELQTATTVHRGRPRKKESVSNRQGQTEVNLNRSCSSNTIPIESIKTKKAPSSSEIFHRNHQTESVTETIISSEEAIVRPRTRSASRQPRSHLRNSNNAEHTKLSSSSEEANEDSALIRPRGRSVSRARQFQTETKTQSSRSRNKVFPVSVDSDGTGESIDRPRTRSVSRTRQHGMLTKMKRTRSHDSKNVEHCVLLPSSSEEADQDSASMRPRGRSVSRARQLQSGTNMQSSRSRNKVVPVDSEATEQIINRPRTRSVSRTRQPGMLTNVSRDRLPYSNAKTSSSSEETDQDSQLMQPRGRSRARQLQSETNMQSSRSGNKVVPLLIDSEASVQVTNRHRTRSVSRTRQHGMLTNANGNRLRNSNDTELTKQKSSSEEKNQECASVRTRGRSVSRAHQLESETTMQSKPRNKVVPVSVDSEVTEELINRPRTRSVSRTRQHGMLISENRGRLRNSNCAEHPKRSSSSDVADQDNAGQYVYRSQLQNNVVSDSDRSRSFSRTCSPNMLNNVNRRRLRNASEADGRKQTMSSDVADHDSARKRPDAHQLQTESNIQSRRSRNKVASEGVTIEPTRKSTDRAQSQPVSPILQPKSVSKVNIRRRRNLPFVESNRVEHSKAESSSEETDADMTTRPPPQSPEIQSESQKQIRHSRKHIFESNTGAQVKKISSSKSVIQSRRETSISKSAVSKMRSKSVTPTNVPVAENAQKRTKTKSNYSATGFRSKSVTREETSSLTTVDARPLTKKSLSEYNIPVYRKYADRESQLSSKPAAIPENRKQISHLADDPASDVYMFDSPSQGSSGSDEGSSRRKVNVKGTKGNSTRRRPKVANVSSRGGRLTPFKKSVFGTNMQTISSVVKKIGGGPVRGKSSKESMTTSSSETAPTKNIVHTSTLAAFVHGAQPPSQRDAHRTPSPSIIGDVDDHQHDDLEEDRGFEMENIPDVEIPTPLSPPKLNPQIQRVYERKVPSQVLTPDKTQPNITLNFSPLGASSPWRIQNENVLPKTFYFSRSKDLLPSYESDLVVQDNNHQLKSVNEHNVPAPSAPALPNFARPTTIPPNNYSKPAAIVFTEIQKSYNQLKATSDMSEKLINAMRKYKTNVHNQTTSLGGESSPEELFAKFREYEENMKKTYQKLKQWYDRSKHTYTHSMKAIEQTVPKTQAQKELVENFRRNSERFLTMMNDLESAMNDSNIENLSPSKSAENSKRPAFKDIILTERNMNDRKRSPLKSLDILNLPPRFSPIKSPLVKASFTSNIASRTIASHSKSRDLFSRFSLAKPAKPPEASEIIPAESVIDAAETLIEEQPQEGNNLPDQPREDLFGFETDIEEEAEKDDTLVSVEPTPMKITRETLKERLQSMRKLLPPTSRTTGESSVKEHQNLPRIFNSPHRKRLKTIPNAFSSSTPLAEKRKRLPDRREEQVEPEASNISAIGGTEAEKPTGNENVRKQQESPPAAVFDDPELEFASTSLTNVNRTYSRIPQRKRKRKMNIYLANLGLSDSEEEEESDWQPSDSEIRKEKRRRKEQQKKPEKKRHQKKTVEQTAEFQNFVSEFNTMCDQVNQYQLVIDKPTSAQQQV